MTLGKKLLLSFASVIGLTLIFAFTSVATISNLGSTISGVLTKSAASFTKTDEISRSVAGMKDYAKMTQFSYSLSRVADKKTAGDCIACHSIPDATAAQRDFDAMVGHIHKDTGELRQNLDGTGAAQVDVIDLSTDQLAGAFRQFLAEASQGKFADAHSVITDRMEPQREKIDKATSELEKLQAGNLAGIIAGATRQVSNARWITLLLVTLCILVGLVILSIVRRMNVSLHTIVQDLAQASAFVSTQASEIASSSKLMADSASNQAASADEIRIAGNSLSGSANENASETESMAGFVREIHSGVNRADGTLKDGLEAMHRIDESSSRIARIIKVINEIAFQTNLLALNAAVEAARAGEAGLGFAVVAEEVRALAQRCAGAAKETETLIGESIERSPQGKARLETLAQDIAFIVEHTNSLESAVEHLGKTSAGQADSVQSISRTLSNIDGTATQTAAQAEETAAAGVALSESAAELDRDVQDLLALVGK